MLNKRLELVEAERDLEIEKEFPSRRNQKKDISVINAKIQQRKT